MSRVNVQQIVGGVVCLLLAGCASTTVGSNVPDMSSEPFRATETPVSTEDVRTATAWARHRAAQTLAAQETTTPTQTPSPVPTLVPSSTPWGSLSPSGPWLVGRSLVLSGEGDGYLWAANPDLSGLTRLIPEPVIAYAIRTMDTIASGLTTAYATRSCRDCIDITLKIVTLPGGEPKTIASLYPADQGSEFSDYTRSFMNALTDGGLAWSPDGRTLAFASSLSDFSVDVYTYNLDTGQITQLSDGLFAAYRLGWSPDGRYVIYEGNDSTDGASSQVIRSVPVGGGPNISLIDEGHVRDLARYGWQSPTQILLGATHFEEQGSILSVNVATGDSEVIAHASQFDRGAYSEKHQAWLLTRYDPNEPLDPALLLCRGGDCQAVSSERLSWVSWVWWSSSYDVFLGLSEQGELYQITPGGAVSKLPVKVDWDIPIVIESPDGTRWAWHSWNLMRSGSTSVYLGDPLTQPRVLVNAQEMQMHQVAWSPDSQHLLMFGDTNTYIASQPGFEPILAIEGWTATDVTWVK